MNNMNKHNSLFKSNHPTFCVNSGGPFTIIYIVSLFLQIQAYDFDRTSDNKRIAQYSLSGKGSHFFGVDDNGMIFSRILTKHQPDSTMTLTVRVEKGMS